MTGRKLSLTRKFSNSDLRDGNGGGGGGGGGGLDGMRGNHPPPTRRQQSDYNYNDTGSIAGSDRGSTRSKGSFINRSRRRLSDIFKGDNGGRNDRNSPAPETYGGRGANGNSNGNGNGNGYGSSQLQSQQQYSNSSDARGAPNGHANGGANGSVSGRGTQAQRQANSYRAAPAVPNGNGNGVRNANGGANGGGLAEVEYASPHLKSLYTQWYLGEDDDSDDDGYKTPEQGDSDDFTSPDRGDVVAARQQQQQQYKAPAANGYANGHAATRAPAPQAPVSQHRTAPSTAPVAGGAAAVGGTAAAAATAHANMNSKHTRSSSFSSGPKVSRGKNSGGAKVAKRHVMAGNALDINQAKALPVDLDLCREVLDLFLSSKMKESEALLADNDPQNNHLYLQVGLCLIQTLKGLMTFDNEDILTALDQTRGLTTIASALRKPTESVLFKLRPGASIGRIKQMTPLELHSELIYAESMLMKAILSIVGGGDWLGLIREAFNMRAAHGIYRTLQQFLEEQDKYGFDENIDMDFRSGVILGTGTSSLMLSLLPGKVLKVAEVFGYAGDRTVALKTLMTAGGWVADSDEPEYNEETEGIRRPICDMILLTFHLVISVLMPVSGVDLSAARKILKYNTRRYPDGIFFLYFQARLHTSEGEPELANECLQRALELDLEYIQLQHMCLWDYGCNYLQLTNWNGALHCFDILRKESNWSRAVYTYAMAVNVMELVDDDRAPEADQRMAQELVDEIPKLTRKIAGKSIPIEKLAARKARKFLMQGSRLFLPAMELAYVFGSLGRTPRYILLGRWLPKVNAELAKLEASTPETWGNGQGYWDDYALGHFLRGMVQFTAVYQPPEACDHARARSPGEPSDDALNAGAEADFKMVIANAPQVRLDHWILYHNHYELGRLYARRKDAANALANFNVVMNNKLPEANTHAGKGKYSLEGALQLKTHAAIQALQEQQNKW